MSASKIMVLRAHEPSTASQEVAELLEELGVSAVQRTRLFDMRDVYIVGDWLPAVDIDSVVPNGAFVRDIQLVLYAAGMWRKHTLEAYVLDRQRVYVDVLDVRRLLEHY